MKTFSIAHPNLGAKDNIKKETTSSSIDISLFPNIDLHSILNENSKLALIDSSYQAKVTNGIFQKAQQIARSI